MAARAQAAPRPLAVAAPTLGAVVPAARTAAAARPRPPPAWPPPPCRQTHAHSGQPRRLPRRRCPQSAARRPLSSGRSGGRCKSGGGPPTARTPRPPPPGLRPWSTTPDCPRARTGRARRRAGRAAGGRPGAARRGRGPRWGRARPRWWARLAGWRPGWRRRLWVVCGGEGAGRGRSASKLGVVRVAPRFLSARFRPSCTSQHTDKRIHARLLPALASSTHPPTHLRCRRTGRRRHRRRGQWRPRPADRCRRRVSWPHGLLCVRAESAPAQALSTKRENVCVSLSQLCFHPTRFPSSPPHTHRAPPRCVWGAAPGTPCAAPLPRASARCGLRPTMTTMRRRPHPGCGPGGRPPPPSGR